ncbi:MAG: histidine kinase dimerization/phospho-acceptor domain-containing protein, partial [Terriglobia bacterium]
MAIVLPPRTRPALPLLTVLVSIAGLLVSGFFLYRWVNRLSELDLRRQQENLDASVVNLQREFAATLREAMWFFRPMPGLPRPELETTYSELYSQWKTAARWPQVIRTISIALRSGDGSIGLAQLDPKAEKFKAVSWPASLRKFRDALSGDPDAALHWRSLRARGLDRVVLDGDPVLVLPLVISGPGRAAFVRTTRSQSSRSVSSAAPEPVRLPPRGALENFALAHAARRIAGGARPTSFQFVGWCFLRLNSRFIEARLIPFLVNQYFGRPGLAKYRIAVIAENPKRFIYASAPEITLENIFPADARIPLFGRQRVVYYASSPTAGAGSIFISAARVSSLNLRAPSGFPPRQGPPPDPHAPSATAPWSRPWPNSPSDGPARWRRGSGAVPGAWQLVARDRMGSLAAAIAAARRRDLAIGFGMLLLLAGSIAAMVVGTYRAHTLATRQMEFVAGISHELRTPLTVINSAAFNLAMGKVDDANRVRQYGQAIQTESHRLSGLFGQTLAYAGIQAGSRQYDFKPVHVLEVVDSALAEYTSDFVSKGWQVEK